MNILLILALLAKALDIDDILNVDSCNATSSDAIPDSAITQTLAESSESLFFNSQESVLSVTQSTDGKSTQSNPGLGSLKLENIFQHEFQPTSNPQASVPEFRSLSETLHAHVNSNTETESTYSFSSHTSTSHTFSVHSVNPPLPDKEIAEKCPFFQMRESSDTSNSSETCHNQCTSVANTSEPGRFMSFEEWKKQKKLELDANSAESDVSSASRSPSSSLRPEQKAHQLSKVVNDSLVIYEEQGRTYKDKFNYASVDCAATVVKTNSDAKGASAILTEVKDSYLINQCSTPNKFIVVELCQDVLISSIVMGNFELFSSMFRTVRFSVSDRFPAVDGWHELGQFEAQNRRDVQSFSIENPLIWSRYLKIDILSHYGNEFYCPLSILRVHGTNMMEDFKNTEMTNKPKPGVSSPTEEFLNYTVDFDDECKALSPYLAMNEFLKVFNSSSQFCGITTNASGTSTVSTATKATQESIFQNIIKRLSLLESNASLSLLYVEEQSKLLSDAFTSLEERQVKKFEGLLMQFNENIHSQVKYLDASLQKINKESQKVLQTSRVFTSGAVKRIKMETAALVSELTFLKKLVVIDTVIILSLLVYVVFRETFVADDLLKRENASGIKRSPIKSFPVSKRKAKFKQRRW